MTLSNREQFFHEDGDSMEHRLREDGFDSMSLQRDVDLLEPCQSCGRMAFLDEDGYCPACSVLDDEDGEDWDWDDDDE